MGSGVGSTGKAYPLLEVANMTPGQLYRNSLARRLWSRVDKDIAAPCWIWTGTIVKPAGYGIIWANRRYQTAHRISYELIVGEIPEGLVIDHLCRNRKCVNPDHLEPVTTKENLLRGVGVAAALARRVSCSKGHPFDGENLVIGADGYRLCVTCRKDKRKREIAERKEKRRLARLYGLPERAEITVTRLQ